MRFSMDYRGLKYCESKFDINVLPSIFLFQMIIHGLPLVTRVIQGLKKVERFVATLAACSDITYLMSVREKQSRLSANVSFCLIWFHLETLATTGLDGCFRRLLLDFHLWKNCKLIIVHNGNTYNRYFAQLIINN